MTFIRDGVGGMHLTPSIKIPEGAKNDDLSEKDLEKTAGGGRCSATWFNG